MFKFWLKKDSHGMTTIDNMCLAFYPVCSTSMAEGIFKNVLNIKLPQGLAIHLLSTLMFSILLFGLIYYLLSYWFNSDSNITSKIEILDNINYQERERIKPLIDTKWWSQKQTTYALRIATTILIILTLLALIYE